MDSVRESFSAEVPALEEGWGYIPKTNFISPGLSGSIRKEACHNYLHVVKFTIMVNLAGCSARPPGIGYEGL